MSNIFSRRTFLTSALCFAGICSTPALSRPASPVTMNMPLHCPNGHWLGATGCLAGSACEFGNFLNTPPLHKTRLHKANTGTIRQLPVKRIKPGTAAPAIGTGNG